MINFQNNKICRLSGGIFVVWLYGSIYGIFIMDEDFFQRRYLALCEKRKLFTI